MILLQTKAFIRDGNKLKMSDKHFTKFVEYLHLLSQGQPLPTEAKDHALSGEWENFRECHIGVGGDLLLIYQIEAKAIKLIRMGSQSQLFKC